MRNYSNESNAVTYLLLSLHVLADASIDAAHLPHAEIRLARHLHHTLLETKITHPATEQSDRWKSVKILY